MEKIEKVQYQAALAITGCWRGTNRNKIYEELGWESLSDRRWSRRLFYFYKIHNNLTPEYLRENLPRIRDPTPRNNNLTLYNEFSCKSMRYQNSFFPDSVKSWNNVGVDFSISPTIGHFKKNIYDLIRPHPKSVYGIHDPLGLKYLFQVRVGLSALKCHKKKHNFIDTPNDWCECRASPEDVDHFLFSCHLHALPRIDLCSSVSNLLAANDLNHLINDTELYLYGHRSLNSMDNKTILLASIQFFKESNRFS